MEPRRPHPDIGHPVLIALGSLALPVIAMIPIVVVAGQHFPQPVAAHFFT